LPQCEPARAVEDPFGDYGGKGLAPCLTEVVDWPFSEDENGIAFDQENLYGVRTRVWRLPIDDGGGDYDEWYTAVPKTLPEGYEIQGRMHTVVPHIADHLGDSIGPVIGSSIIVRGPSTNDLFYLDDAKKNWTPMNRDQLGYNSFISPFTATIDGVTGYSFLAFNHIGFRAGGKLTTFILGHGGDPSYIFDNTGVMKFYSRDYGSTGSVTYLGEVAVELTQGSTSRFVETNIPFALNSQTLGKTSDFFIRGIVTIRETGPGGAPSDPPTYGVVEGTWSSGSFNLGPRTDVPLWYFSATKNKCAPGGLVI